MKLRTKLLNSIAAVTLLSLLPLANANATELEVTHWWTSGSESAAVAEFANAFNATGNTWVDGAVAGGGGTALPIIISRIVGGSPMGATQLVHGRQAEELIEAGLMLDLTELAEKENWKDIVDPISLLNSCTYDGKVYCVPTNIHSQQWLWVSHKAFADAGVDVPTNWNEFVAAEDALIKAGKIPLALGRQSWQSLITFNVMMASIAGPDLYVKIYGDKDVDAAKSAEMTAVFENLAVARKLAKESKVQAWNEANNMVITGQAGAQIMGDWARGEFLIAGQTPGKDYSCLAGLGVNEVVSTGGNAFYFPVLDDEAKTAAQIELASLLISPKVQVAFNLKKGSLPVRGDVDLGDQNECMSKGLELLAAGKTVPSIEQLITPDTQSQLVDLASRFLADESISVEDAQAQFVDIIGSAD